MSRQLVALYTTDLILNKQIRMYISFHTDHRQVNNGNLMTPLKLHDPFRGADLAWQ
ncbi:hypothetical protein D1AOALGA4SA_6433 [Olavius algarvensis Delta 1 endosymbiont]|nr:hypothetical protein D1AOALGA4SA_6433 [Olavius algarvensis Delta 1 endosymbiont]